jgi:hypothetical protein
MSTTLTRSRSNGRPTPEVPRFRGTGHRRRPTVAIASFALVASCVAIFTTIYAHAGNRVEVLAVVHTVPQGQAVTARDLVVVSISISSRLSPVPARYLGRVVGRRTLVSLLPGSLLNLKELATSNDPEQGKAVVGVATKVGQLPAGGVATGDTVDVVLTGSPTTLGGGAPAGIAAPNGLATGQLEIGGVLARSAKVTAVAHPTSSNSDTIVVSVSVPSELAPIVASASAAGQVALVLVGPSS